jgi:PTH1 family peptidyl-tRNA hydrolase
MSWLVVGLGNPGLEYAHSRHNIGFLVADLLASRWGSNKSAFRSKFSSDLLQAEWGGHKILLQKPMQFMNLSGGPVQGAMAFYRIALDHIIVVHDDIDLELGRIKVKQGGGHGGHNGLRSISQAVGADYLRVRGGVGRPGGSSGGKNDRVVNHVLGSFNRAEQQIVAEELVVMAEAIEALIAHGVAYAMNHFNKGP